MDFGPAQIAIVLIIGLLVFGPRRLPELGKSLGSSMREFKDSISGDREHEEKPAQLELEARTESVSAGIPDRPQAVKTKA